MATLKEKKELFEQGLTRTEIAKQLGISRQAVSQALARYNPAYFKLITESNCIYPNIREWMNKNKVSMNEFVRRMGCASYAGNFYTLKNNLTGKTDTKKSTIDKILAITGMTYELAFDLGDNEC